MVLKIITSTLLSAYSICNVHARVSCVENDNLCRNCKTSQEAVDYVRARLTQKRDGEISQQDLITICEAVSI